MIEEFKKLVGSIETVSVQDSRQSDSQFTLEIRIEESELGWIALEAIARIGGMTGLTLLACATEMPRSLSFEIQGRLADIGDALVELREIVFPADSTTVKMTA